MTPQDFSDRIRAAAETFIADVLDALTESISAQAAELDPRPATPGPHKVAPPQEPRKRGRPRKTEAAPATPMDLESRILAAVKGEEEGLRMEQIAKKLGTSTQDLTVPVKGLLGSGKLLRKGVARGSRYRLPD